MGKLMLKTSDAKGDVDIQAAILEALKDVSEVFVELHDAVKIE